MATTKTSQISSELFDIEQFLMQENILPQPSVEFNMFDTTPIITLQNPNCPIYVQNVQRTIGSETLVTMNSQSLVNIVVQCQNNALEELEREGTDEITQKLCSTMVERHAYLSGLLKQNVDVYERYCHAVQNEPCDNYQNVYEVYQRFLATFNDAEIHLRNYLVFVLDEVNKLSTKKSKKKKGEHAKVLPKEATATLWQWFTTNYKNPYPTENEKRFLSQQTGLTVQQIANWMDNHRRRYPEWKQGKAPEGGPRLKEFDDEVEQLQSHGVAALTLDEELLTALAEKIEVTDEPSEEENDGPSKDEMKAIRAHTLLMKLGTKKMLDISEKEFNHVVQEFRKSVLDDYEKCSVISEDRAMELWRDATMRIFKNVIEYEQEIEKEEISDDAYRNMMKKNVQVEKELWESLL